MRKPAHSKADGTNTANIKFIKPRMLKYPNRQPISMAKAEENACTVINRTPYQVIYPNLWRQDQQWQESRKTTDRPRSHKEGSKTGKLIMESDINDIKIMRKGKGR